MSRRDREEPKPGTPEFGERAKERRTKLKQKPKKLGMNIVGTAKKHKSDTDKIMEDEEYN